MCEIASGQEQTLDVPITSLISRNSFAMDCGGSALKIVYTVENTDCVVIHCVTFPRERIEEGLFYLRDKVKGHLEPGAKFYATGVGCSEFLDKIESVMGVKVTIIVEAQATKQGFFFLTHNVPFEELIHRFSEETVKKSNALSSQYKRLMSWVTGKAYEETHQSKDQESLNSDPSLQFPVLVAQLGSATGLAMFQEDGTITLLEALHTSGRLFTGLGSLLTGAKTFEELMALAVKGNRANVDQMLSGIKKSVASDDAYRELDLDISFYPFSHCSGKNIDDFRKEDIAASLLDCILQNIAIFVHHWAIIENVHQVLFTGSLGHNSEFIRNELGKYLTVRNESNVKGHKVDFHFLKLGAYVGCVGALVHATMPNE